jgi:DnaJ-class molecular chaperone
MTAFETITEEPITPNDQICTTCEGFGWALWDGQPCKSCGGTGFGFFQGTD